MEDRRHVQDRAPIGRSAFHHLTASAEVRPAGAKGRGVYATAGIPAGTVVAGWGGMVVDRAAFADHEEAWEHAVQIAEDLFLLPPPDLEAADLVNHSCAPNCGMEGNIVLVAMRDIEAGEELCFDYAMTDDNPYFGFACECGQADCRGTVSGDDWQREELWDRYDGYFSPYLAKRIARLRSSTRP